MPTHSLINYAHWRIVSPESSLAGSTAATATSPRSGPAPRGRRTSTAACSKERTFETAFLEYGAMKNLVRATGRTVWFLNDPIEDNPRHDWTDYRTNWECTLIASLLQPEVWQYEVMPWPERIFRGRYPTHARKPEDAQANPAGVRHRAAGRHHGAQRHEAAATSSGTAAPRASACSSAIR